MDYIQTILDSIITNFDFAYMISVNVLTYCIIKLVDYLNKEKAVSTLIKRTILVSCVALLALIYIIIGYDNYIVLLNSSIAAPVFYSWVLRPILKKLKIGYKQYDESLNV